MFILDANVAPPENLLEFRDTDKEEHHPSKPHSLCGYLI
jgi:hypothetical protein